MPLTFLLCDDHALFREGLAALLARQPGMRVIAQAENGDEAVRLAGELKPDLAVLDVAMPGMSGVDAAAQIRDVSPQTRIIALSMYGDAHYRQRMLDAGAGAYVLKNDASAELLAAVDAVLRGETYLSPTLRDRAAPQPQRSVDIDMNKLTPREHDVFRLLALGRRTRDIADALGISVKTVETYRSHIMLKLGVDNLAQLVKVAIRAGIVSID